MQAAHHPSLACLARDTAVPICIHAYMHSGDSLHASLSAAQIWSKVASDQGIITNLLDRQVKAGDARELLKQLLSARPTMRSQYSIDYVVMSDFLQGGGANEKLQVGGAARDQLQLHGQAMPHGYALGMIDGSRMIT